MIFITGPLFAGKRSYAKEALGLEDEAFSTAFSTAFPTECPVVFEAQELARGCKDLEALADRLARKQAVICTEVGGGIVPIDRDERQFREQAGRLAVLLAQRAERVVRVWCGLPQVLKGEPL